MEFFTMNQETDDKLQIIYQNSNLNISFDEFKETIKKELGDSTIYTSETLDKIINKIRTNSSNNSKDDFLPLTNEQLEKIENQVAQIPEEAELPISEQDSVQLRKNAEYLDSKKDFDPFELNPDGTLKHPEYKDAYNTFKKLVFTDEQGKKLSTEETVKYQEALKKSILLDAETTFATDTSNPSQNPEDRYKEAFTNAMNIAICATAYGSDFDYRNADKKQLAEKAFAVTQNKDSYPIKQSVVINYAGIVCGNASNRCNKLHHSDNPNCKFAATKLAEKIQAFDAHMQKIAPKSYPIAKRLGKIFTKRVKNIAIYTAVGAVAGPVGLGFLAVKGAYDGFKNLQKQAKKENLSLANYAKLHKAEVGLLITTNLIAGTASALGLGVGGQELASTISPYLKTATQALALAPSLLKTAKHSGKILLTKLGLRKDNIQEEKKLASQALNQAIDVGAGLLMGTGINSFMSGEPAQAATPVLDDNPIDNQETQQTDKIEVSRADRDFWDNRADKFLGENTTNKLYERIDNGEIKLPSGIESKEEFAYKLAMAMEQTPAYVTEALGTEFQTTAKLEAGISSMTADQFSKLNNLLNDFDDRGNYVGNRTFAPTIENHQDTEDKPVGIPETQKQEQKPEAEAETAQKEEKESRTEEYYQQQIDALKQSESNPNSLKETLNQARKDDSIYVDDALNNYLYNQIDNNNLTEKQGEELAYYINYELDARDNKQIDGYVQDEELSRRELNKSLKAVNNTLESLRDNATEITFAQNLQYNQAENTPQNVAETYSKDTKSAQFYEGMSAVLDDMQNDKAPLQTSMKEAIINGELSEEQVAAINGRYNELRQEGNSINKSLDTMQKDYNNMGKFFNAQEKIQELRDRIETKNNISQSTEQTIQQEEPKQSAPQPVEKETDKPTKTEEQSSRKAKYNKYRDDIYY